MQHGHKEGPLALHRAAAAASVTVLPGQMYAFLSLHLSPERLLSEA